MTWLCWTSWFDYCWAVLIENFLICFFISLLSLILFLCLVHLHSNFQLIPIWSLCDIGKSFDCLTSQNRLCNFYQGWVKLCISTRLISNHQKALFWCLPSYIPIFSLFLKAVYPVGMIEFLKITHNSLIVNQIYPKCDIGICLYLPHGFPNFSQIEHAYVI